jgi:hypothetical protein
MLVEKCGPSSSEIPRKRCSPFLSTRYPRHMPPKTPDELRAQIEAQQGEPAASGNERTAEGMETRTPSASEFFGNLRKIARKPLPKRRSSTDK